MTAVLTPGPSEWSTRLAWTYWPLLVVVSIVFGIRVSFRWWRRTLGWDDAWMGLAYIICVYSVAFSQLAINAGYGRHIGEVFENIERIAYWHVVTAIPVPIGIAAVRISCIISVLRLIDRSPSSRYIYWICIGNLLLFVPFTITFFFLQLFQCVPLSDAWKITANTSQCRLRQAFFPVLVTQAALSIVCDLLTAILPVLIISKLQMDRTRKIGLCILFGLGAIIAAFPLARIIVGYVDIDPTDVTYTYAPVDLLIAVEVLGGVFVACLPAVASASMEVKRKLLSQYSTGSRPTGSRPSGSRPTGSRNSRASIGLLKIPPFNWTLKSFGTSSNMNSSFGFSRVNSGGRGDVGGQSWNGTENISKPKPYLGHQQNHHGEIESLTMHALSTDTDLEQGLEDKSSDLGTASEHKKVVSTVMEITPAPRATLNRVASYSREIPATDVLLE